MDTFFLVFYTALFILIVGGLVAIAISEHRRRRYWREYEQSLEKYDYDAKQWRGR